MRPINQSTNQPINQSTNQPINQSTNQPIGNFLKHLLMVVFLFSSTVSYSQEYTGLFNYIQPPQELDSISTATIDKIIADTTVVNYHFVTVNPIEYSVVDFKIPINFPQGEINHGTHLFEYNHVEFLDSNNYVWHGYINDLDTIAPQSGYGTLINDEGVTYGSFALDLYNFDIIGLSENHSILIEYQIDTTKYNRGYSLSDTPQEAPDSLLSAEIRSIGPCPVRLLILYTPRADERVSNISQKANVAYNELRNVLNNSEIRDHHFKLELMGIEKIGIDLSDELYSDPKHMISEIFPEGGSLIQSYLDNIYRDNRDPKPHFIVILAETDFFRKIEGAAPQGLEDSKKTPYAIIQASLVNSRYLFSHEVGHLFGAHHEHCDAGSWVKNCTPFVGDYNHAHRFRQKNIVQKEDLQ